MNKINAALNLNPEASSEAQLEAINLLKAEAGRAEELQNNLSAEKNKLKLLAEENKSLKESQAKKNAEDLVNSAVSSGKILESAKDKWIESAVKDFESTKSLIESLTGAPASIDNSLKKDDKKSLADKYQKIVDENPAQLDKLPKEEVEAMENAWIEIHDKKTSVQKEN